jgi:hypothetical protein
MYNSRIINFICSIISLQIMTKPRQRPTPEYVVKDGDIEVSYSAGAVCSSLYGYRVNPAAYNRMREIDQIHVVNQALEAIIDLCHNYTRFEEARFVPGSPNPEQEVFAFLYKWTRCADDDHTFPGRFGTEFQVSGNTSDHSYFSRPCLAKDVIQKIRERKRTISTDHGRFQYQ